ncbi:hypothetical protein EVAR_91673_1 [Eumeta japonica]|uniref:Uncharacterized protein n=1 Tax=Eumeta variegata TaxID=151549 RepID=A0A4C1Z2I0_EUMVA|nr:hypothetical protein EVAR_91673_1 [Eumeta japonica]
MVTILEIQTARILSVIPTATVSHYACARKIILELCRRGHEVVSISPYEEKNAPDNLTWIPVRAKSIMESVTIKVQMVIVVDEHSHSQRTHQCAAGFLRGTVISDGGDRANGRDE